MVQKTQALASDLKNVAQLLAKKTPNSKLNIFHLKVKHRARLRLYDQLGQVLVKTMLQQLDLCGFWAPWLGPWLVRHVKNLDILQDSGADAGVALGKHLAKIPTLRGVIEFVGLVLTELY